MNSRTLAVAFSCLLAITGSSLSAQTLLNVDFGVGSQSAKRGFAGTGQTTNDYWNLFRFYDPKYVPGMPLMYNGSMADLKLSDGSPSPVSISVSNAPGVWGNATGDPMFDSYIFAQNGSNIMVTVSKLEAGRYNVFLYGHADPDASAEQNSVFRLHTGATNYGPLTAVSSAGWKSTQAWQESCQYVAFRDVEVKSDTPLVIQVAPGPNGIAVLNGLQIISKGTSPPRLVEVPKVPTTINPTNLVIREIRYTGTVNDAQALFAAEMEIESLGTNTVSAPLFEGDLAVVTRTLPEGLSIVRLGNEYRLMVSAQGTYKLGVDVVAKIVRLEPWNQIKFVGPPAAIGSITASAEGEGVELQLLSGTPLEGNGPKSRVQGVLNADHLVTLRWQSKAAEVARKALITVETASTARVAPTVVKFTTELHYEILQASVPRLTVAIPAGQSLTRLQGDQIRDWKVESSGSNQILSVEFLRPMEKSCALTLFSEEPCGLEETKLVPPQPLAIERESGSLTVYAEDALVKIGSLTGLRQVTAPAGALAAYRFYGRPAQLSTAIKRVEPAVKTADRIKLRVEETRLLISHAMTLTVEKSGVYAIEMMPQTGFTVSEVKGDGVEDWKVRDGALHVSFANRVLGDRALSVQLEQPLKTLPPRIDLLPLRLAGASKETAQVGAAAVPGLQIKTVELVGLAEIPASQLTNRTDELLAFNSQEPGWKLSLAAERLPARVTAEVFNLMTVGDGLVGGSATVRYGIVNQGVQEFRLALPGHWKNVEFTGANIRSKEQQGNTWIVSLQEKVWDGYTLVVTYDYQFDPTKAQLDAAGLHTLDAEHETGSVAITTAASLKLQPGPVAEPIHQIDPTELSDTDRALITRPVLLAYRYSGAQYQLRLGVERHAEERGLAAVADRTQITSVLTESGEMLTQASFIVKNNDKQFQRFQLPADATFWGCYVNNQPSKAERDGRWLMISLPRGENRDEAFAVDLVYAQKIDPLNARLFPRSLEFRAPATDVPNTYAEWELYVPANQRLSGFGGTMNVARGTTYDLRDAWQRFGTFYRSVWSEYGWPLAIFAVVGILATGALVGAVRRGWRGLMGFLMVVGVLAVLAAMAVPNFVKARSASQTNAAINNLRQVDAAIRQWAQENGSREMPANLAAVTPYLGRSAGPGMAFTDPETGEPFTYVGAGKSLIDPNAIIAYSAPGRNGRKVLYGSGITVMNGAEFMDALEREAHGEPLKTREQPEGVIPANGIPNQAPSGGIGGYVSSPVQTNAAPHTAAGIRSIRIDLPRNGQPYTFTKVLNITQEPLAVKLSVMAATVYSTARSAAQITTFLLGLGVFWVCRRLEHKFRMTLGLALALGAVTALLLSARVLHLALIAAFPVLLLAVVILVVLKLLPRAHTAQAGVIPPSSPDAGIPPIAAAVAILLFSVFSANAQSANDSVRAPAIISAAYAGAVRETAAEFEGTLQISSSGTNQTLALFGSDVALENFTKISGDARLLRENGRISLLLSQPGATVVSVKFLAKLAGDVSKRQLAFQLPSALSSRFVATIDEPEADVEFPAAVALKRTTAGQQTRVEAVIGSSDRVDMQWMPRVKRAAEIAATVFAENRSLVSFGGGVIDVRAALAFQITQGELRQTRVRLPADYRLLRVDGESIRTWEIKEENGRPTLVIDLLKGASTNWNATIEIERVLESLPVATAVEVPRVLDVKRENGWVAIRGGEEVTVAVESAQDLQRVDAADFGPSDKTAELLSVYRFVTPDFRLRVKAEPVRPSVDVQLLSRVNVSSDQISLASTLCYAVKRAGIFGFKLGLPDGYKTVGVTGANIQQWTTRDVDGKAILDIVFDNRITGSNKMEVQLAKRLAELPKVIVVPGLLPLEVDKLSESIEVHAEPGLAIKTAAIEGVVETPIVGNNSAGTTLAYNVLNTEPSATPNWKLEIAVEMLDSWIRAEIGNIVSVSEGLVNGHALVRYDIQNAPAQEFRLKIPTNYSNVEITGPAIRRRDHNGDEWRVELQNKVNGSYLLDVSWEESTTLKTNAMEVAGIQALGVERETGVLVIKTKSPLQVSEERTEGELIKTDVREIPDWVANAARSGDSVVLSYRYVRPGYRLILQAKRFEEAAVLQALVDQARFTTVIASDGQIMTEMSVSVRNNGLQHLEVQLPPESSMWSAFVGGQPVRPAVRAGKLLVPLETGESGDDAPVSVELTYVGKEKFPHTQAAVRLDSPTFDVPLKNARWDLYLPQDYDYSRFAGSMAHIAEVAPMVQTYSLLEYRAQEAAKKANRKAETFSNLGMLNQQLAAGNTKSLNNAYSQLRSEASDDSTRRQLNDLASNLMRIQGDNLIQGQRAYNGQQGFQNQIVYNSEVAKKQWAKLQQAQELAVAKIQPLRINLPTRGVHHAFTQVLQTAVKKPLTVEFFAANAQAQNWVGTFVLAVAAFLALWLAVVILTRSGVRPVPGESSR